MIHSCATILIRYIFNFTHSRLVKMSLVFYGPLVPQNHLNKLLWATSLLVSITHNLLEFDRIVVAVNC